jgi:plasmid maintenance system antidote protein VapI
VNGNAEDVAARVLEIVNGRRSIPADTALRLGRYFGTSAKFLLSLQSRYDLGVAQNDVGVANERAVVPREAIS